MLGRPGGLKEPAAKSGAGENKFDDLVVVKKLRQYISQRQSEIEQEHPDARRSTLAKPIGQPGHEHDGSECRKPRQGNVSFPAAGPCQDGEFSRAEMPKIIIGE